MGSALVATTVLLKSGDTMMLTAGPRLGSGKAGAASIVFLVRMWARPHSPH